MASVQLSFSLRVSSNVKTVHLLGSWDNYFGQLPLSKDKSSSKSGSWKGTFKFQSSTLQPGQRYWYYYIVDGYHVAHNPSVKSTIEPTTGRELNILDVVPGASSSSSSSSRKSSSSSSSHKSSGSSKESSKSSSRHGSSSSSSAKSHRASGRPRMSVNTDVAKGRPLSMSQIQAPKPMSPHATRHILSADYSDSEEIVELTARLDSTSLIEDDVVTDFSTSPLSSLSGSSLSFRSDSSSANSSASGYSTPDSDCSSCTCQRYGITRKGERVKLDCGGSRCGYGDDESCSSIASSGDEAPDYEPVHHSRGSARRHAIIVT